jgi:hypothetical protein
MPKRKQPPLKPEEQFKRFVEIAREIGVDESGNEFEKAFREVVPPKATRKVKAGGPSKRG